MDGSYRQLLASFGINVQSAVSDAGLDCDILDRPRSSMTEEEYYSLMESVGKHISDDRVTIRIASSDSIESFNAPTYAAYCSSDGMSCLRRLSDYKALIGPMMLIVRHNDDLVRIDLAGSPGCILPQFLVEG